ncbi:hypothetical protein DPM33_01735 [Mesorhizobium hawassense]|uniref:Uncharacterized protein n=1 Tax=Mesorhizobium hawassense TaxID=1209954 RepID=A0A330HWF3_9HYPH|nr:hypothetical protein [Mesorhizobium hawassense]RAZ92633.1 hypothetical protein DPM33_01735 [Mesorhizobium hawassense]
MPANLRGAYISPRMKSAQRIVVPDLPPSDLGLTIILAAVSAEGDDAAGQQGTDSLSGQSAVNSKSSRSADLITTSLFGRRISPLSLAHPGNGRA